MKNTLLFLLLTAAFPAIAATTVDSVTVSPAPAIAGQAIKITVGANDVAEGGVCGLVVHWDDGSSEPPQKVGANWPNFPRSFEHTYAKPGTYKIKAEGARAGSNLGCVGSAVTSVTVAAATPVAAPAAAASIALTCPGGWKMKGKVAKDGTFSCTPAKKGAAKPDAPIACPTGTSYYVSNSKLGCEKAQ